MPTSITAFKTTGDKRVQQAISTGLPKHFFPNLELIFGAGRKTGQSAASEKTKTNSTSRRLQLLRRSESQILIRWSIAYPPSVWEGKRNMREDVFERLLTACFPEAELQSATFFQIVLRELSIVDHTAPQSVQKVLNGKLWSFCIWRWRLTFSSAQ